VGEVISGVLELHVAMRRPDEAANATDRLIEGLGTYQKVAQAPC
jgi:hypothetical protein